MNKNVIPYMYLALYPPALCGKHQNWLLLIEGIPDSHMQVLLFWNDVTRPARWAEHVRCVHSAERAGMWFQAAYPQHKQTTHGGNVVHSAPDVCFFFFFFCSKKKIIIPKCAALKTLRSVSVTGARSSNHAQPIRLSPRLVGASRLRHPRQNNINGRHADITATYADALKRRRSSTSSTLARGTYRR